MIAESVQFSIAYEGVRPGPEALPAPRADRDGWQVELAGARTIHLAASLVVSNMARRVTELTADQVKALDRYVRACPRKRLGKRAKGQHWVRLYYTGPRPALVGGVQRDLDFANV